MDNKLLNNIKVGLYGIASVGKKSIMNQYCFNSITKPITGTNHNYQHDELYEDKKYTLIISETFDNPYKSIKKYQLDCFDALILVFSIIDINSFYRIESYLQAIKENNLSSRPHILIGNKSDLDQNRQVNSNDINAIKRKYNINYMESSALTGTNIKDVFQEIVFEYVTGIKQKLKQKALVNAKKEEEFEELIITKSVMAIDDFVQITIKPNIYKMMLFGQSNVGKSSLIYYYINNKGIINNDQIQIEKTIKMTSIIKQEKIGNEILEVHLLDTSGDDCYISNKGDILKDVNSVMLIYDITNRKSYEDIIQLLKKFEDCRYTSLHFIIIGNKCDLTTQRQVTIKEAALFSKSKCFPFYETSAITGSNIQTIFTLFFKGFLAKRRELRRIGQLDTLSNESVNNKRKVN